MGIVNCKMLLSYFVLFLCLQGAFGTGPVHGPLMCGTGDCELPNCRCVGVGTPGSIWAEETPQLVVISMQGKVTDEVAQTFSSILQDRYNPDGCPIGGTWFVYHKNTDYQVVNRLYNQGIELGVMPLLKETELFWEDARYGDWEQGVVGAKRALAYLGNVPMSSIRGMRSHNLIMGGNHQFQALKDSKVSSSEDFLYDSSWATLPRETPNWPFSLDFFPDETYMFGSSPYDSFPGIWEFPLYPYLSHQEGVNCTLLQDCTAVMGSESYKDFLLRNFFYHYQGSRAPFTIQMDDEFLSSLFPYNPEEIIEFLDAILQLDDVYVLSMKDTLEWIRHPKEKSSLSEFPFWSCGTAPEARSCTEACCAYNTDDDCLISGCGNETSRFEMDYKYCVHCPMMIPTWGNPYGLRENVIKCRSRDEL